MSYLFPIEVILGNMSYMFTGTGSSINQLVLGNVAYLFPGIGYSIKELTRVREYGLLVPRYKTEYKTIN